MHKTPDYSNYTLDELFQSYYNVDIKRYPENYRAIVNELKKRQVDLPQEEISELDEVLEEIATPEKISRSEEIPIYPLKKLPIFKIIANAFSISWDNKYNIFRALIVPYIIMSLLSFIQPLIVVNFGIFMGFVVILLESLVTALFVVSCHRLILLGDSSVPKYGLIIPKKREFRFWGWTIALILLISIILGLMTFIMGLINIVPKITTIFIVAIIGGFLFSRFILIFPAVALDLRPSLEWAWKQSAKNGLRLFILIVIPTGPVYGINYLMTNVNSLVLNGLVIFLSFIFTIIGIACISLSYKELCMQDSVNN